jgi:hypothetical protein
MSHLPSHLTRSRRRQLLTAGAGLGTVAAMLASGAVALAAPRPVVGATTQSQIKFVIHEPAVGSVSVDSLSGAGTITTQTATGNNMIGFGTSAGGFSMYAGANANTGQDLIQGATTPGGTVTGTATLSSGSTMTASIDGGPSIAIPNGNFSIPVPTGVGGSRVVTPSVHVSPGSVRAGGTVNVSGVAPSGAKPGAKLTLMSHAFQSSDRVAGFPAVTTPVLKNGTYSATVRIKAKVKPNTYGVTGRIGNRYLPVAALRVRG